jgi:hypothetical protein
MTKQYKIRTATIKDIMDKIPPEKWDECIDEMRVALKQISATVDAIKLMTDALAKASGEVINLSEVVQFPDEITWVDDGLGKNTINIRDVDSGEIAGSIELDCGSKK